MLEFLIALLVMAVIGGLIYYLIMLLPLPAPAKTIAQVVFILICIIILLYYFLPVAHWPLRK